MQSQYSLTFMEGQIENWIGVEEDEKGGGGFRAEHHRRLGLSEQEKDLLSDLSCFSDRRETSLVC